MTPVRTNLIGSARKRVCFQMMQKSYLSQAAPDLGLDRRVHLLLVDGHGDELVQDGGDALALGVIVVLAEAHQVGQPGGHVLQAQVLQLNACNNSHSSHTASTDLLRKNLSSALFLAGLVAKIITVRVEQRRLGKQRSFNKAWQKERVTEPMRNLS